MFKKIKFLGALVAVGLATSGCTETPSTTSTTATTISGQCGEAISTSDLKTLRVAAGRFYEPVIQWGLKEGCFAKQGLRLDIQRIEDAEAAAAISAESIDVMSSSIDQAIIFAANGGFEPRIIVADTGYSAEALERAKMEPLYEGQLLLQTALFVSGDSELKSLSDLRGATIGLRTTVGLTARATLKALAIQGIKENEVSLLEIPTEGIQGAITSGQIDAGVLAGRYATKAAEEGLHLVAYPGAYYYDPGAVTIWMTNSTVLDKKQDSILAFKRAIKQINLLLTNPENEETWKMVLVDELDFEPSVADQTPLPDYWTDEVTLEELQRATQRLLGEQTIRSEPNLGTFIFSLE